MPKYDEPAIASAQAKPAAPTGPKGGSRNLNEERKVFARMIAGQSDAFNEYNMGKLKVIDYE
jgi:hypothetical protein